MSFLIKFSNKVEILFDQLVAGLSEPLTDPLAPEFILVDNPVMGQWLNLQLAQRQGIAANIDFISPHKLFWKLARALMPIDIPEETPLSKEEMMWKLNGLFGDDVLLALPDMLPVANYLLGEDSQELKRFQLASAVADLFDQYLIFRPEWMLRWSSDIKPSKDTNEVWQCLLWQKLAESSPTKTAKQLSHRAIIEQQLLEKLKEEKKTTIQKQISLKRLFGFGIASMPPHLVEILRLLGNHIEVNLHVMNPCQEYWSLIQGARAIAKQNGAEDMHYEIGNPLLASQGVQVGEFISLLQEVTSDSDDHFEGNQDPQSLLESIQQEILTLNYKGESARVDYVTEGNKQKLPDPDGNRNDTIPSVHIHNCHSVMREVEVLHDQLRDILHRNPEMNPRDIVVMIPRVAPYIASIHAVFNSVPENFRIDYHITDRTQAEESPLLISLSILLGLPESRLPLSEVLSLLEVPAIQRRFAIDQTSYDTIKRWLVAAGIRWGVDAEHRSDLGLPSYTESSWDFGFNRLFSGYAMNTQTNSLDSILNLGNGHDVLPYDEVEGGNSSSLNSLLAFWQKLQYLRGVLNQPTSPHSWAERIRQMVDDFYAPVEDSELFARRAIFNALGTLDTAEENGWFLGEIPLAVVRDLLKPSLQQTSTGAHQWREGVKFCSLMPMRGVPFKVVYILGMNLQDYPRRITRRSFDLMRNNHKPGDRASRIDDRWLFLEALLSARKYFHVSYIGRDMHRNEKREPSVVLSELIDYCRHGYDLPEDYLVTEHPLQPFGTAYFIKDRETLSARLVSFNEEARLIASSRRKSITAHSGEARWSFSSEMAASETKLEVSIEDFVKFFTKPWNWFFTKKHKVWLELENDEVSDDENFGDTDTQSLDDWQHFKDLIAMANELPKFPLDANTIRDELVEKLAKLRKAEGCWPLGKSGIEKKESLKKMKPDYLFASYGISAKPSYVKVQVGKGQTKICLTGELPLTDKGVLLIHSASNLGSDKQLDFDIKLALAKELTHQGLTVSEGSAIFRNKTKTVTLSNIDAQQNTEFLSMLASLYVKYNHSGLPFDLTLGEALQKLGDDNEKVEAIESAWNENADWATKGIAFNQKKRTYFGHISALQCSTFYSVSEIFFQSLNIWRKPADQLINQATIEPKALNKSEKKLGKKS